MSSARPFLITGMPRCRAAWLSVLCTTGNSLCYYNASFGFNTIEDLRALYASEYYKFVGVADTALSLFLPEIIESIKPRTLIIDREPERATDLTRRARESMLQFQNHPLVMWVPFEALHTKRVIQKLFWHLMPEATFDECRYEQLEKMRIGADPDESAREYKRRKPQIEQFLRTAGRAMATA